MEIQGKHVQLVCLIHKHKKHCASIPTKPQKNNIMVGVLFTKLRHVLGFHMTGKNMSLIRGGF